MFQGSMVALVTPMEPTGIVDEAALRALIERHIEAKTEAIVVLGTTGECPTLTEGEQKKIIEIAVATAKGRVPIIAGTGTYSTMATIYQTEVAMQLGVDACLLITPYYNKPTQEGLYQHFKAVAEAVPIPLILYNNPIRTGCSLLPETVARLSYFSNIVALKDATGDLAEARALLAVVGDRIELYTGDDPSSLAFLLQGGKGVISVTANVVPHQMRDMCAAALARNIHLAGQLNAQLMPLHKNLFLESNPIPVKWALHKMGWIKEGIRLPLTTLSESFQANVEDAMKIAGVI
jgi:4-hydroxy-tetrahydrodipicolinate synthase